MLTFASMKALLSTIHTIHVRGFLLLYSTFPTVSWTVPTVSINSASFEKMTNGWADNLQGVLLLFLRNHAEKFPVISRFSSLHFDWHMVPVVGGLAYGEATLGGATDIANVYQLSQQEHFLLLSRARSRQLLLRWICQLPLSSLLRWEKKEKSFYE